MRRALVLANPAAGVGGAPGLAEEAKRILGTAPGWEARLALTEAPRAWRAAGPGGRRRRGRPGRRRWRDGRCEAAAGVDGTRTALGIAPVGTGNSSFRELYEDGDWTDILARGLDRLPTRAVDVAHVEPTGELSLLGFSVGWFAQVLRVARGLVGEPGRARYAAAAQLAAQSPERFAARVELDGKAFADGELGLVAVGGARRRGGVFAVLPGSRIDDGLLEVMAVRACGPEDFGRLLGQVMQGTHGDDPLVRMGRGHELTLTSGMPLPAEVDGELWEKEVGRCSVVVVPKALRVLAP